MPDTAQTVSTLKGVFLVAQEGLKGIGIPGVEAVAGLPLLLIKCYENLDKNKEQLIALLDHFQTLHKVVLALIEEARGEHIRVSDADWRRLDDLTTSLHACTNALLPLTSLKRKARLFKQEIIASTLEICRSTIVDALTKFKLDRQIIVHRLVQSLHDKAVLKTLKTASARFDASTKSPCLEGTRTAILTSIHRLLDDPNNFLVCLFGSPGTGKSAVAKTIAADLHKRRHLAASHFFDKRRNGGQNADLRAFVSSIAVQLASFSPEFRTTLIQLLERDSLLAEATAQVQLHDLLLQSLRSLAAPQKRLLIILDALDECGDRFHHEALMKLLRDCVELRSHIVLFITSRPETPFTSVLSDEKLEGLVAAESLDQSQKDQTSRDIEVFVEAELKRILRQHYHVSSVLPTPHDVAEVVRLSGGLFELAAIRLRQIDAHHFNHPLQRAVAIVLADGQSLGAGEGSLVEIYRAVLMAAFPDLYNTVQSKVVLEEYHAVVGALASLHEPLGVQPLAALLGMTEDTVRSRLRPLSSVISVMGNGPIQFYHSSFLEFLTSEASSAGVGIPPEYRINSAQANVTIAARSIIVMNQADGLSRNPLHLSDPYMLNNAISKRFPSLVDSISTQLRYACLHWADHLRVDYSSQCHVPLIQWCAEKIIFYVEMLSLLGAIERAVPLLLNAEDWARKVNIQASTVTLLYDARRLVLMFHAALSHSAGAVYSSALPFMPECTLHRLYSYLVDNQVQLLRGRLFEWPSQMWSRAHPAAVFCIAVSSDGRHVASACGDHHVRILSSTTGNIEQTFKGHSRDVRSVAFSSDGALVASGSTDCSIRLWLTTTGELERILEGHSAKITSVAFSPNNLQIVSGSSDKTVRLWSIPTGEQERMLEGHTKDVMAVAYSPDGLHVVSGSRDHSIRVWSAVTGVQEQTLTGHSAGVHSVAFSPDGNRIVSGSSLDFPRIWFSTTGMTERVLEPEPQNLNVRGYDRRANSVVFFPDGIRVHHGNPVPAGMAGTGIYPAGRECVWCQPKFPPRLRRESERRQRVAAGTKGARLCVLRASGSLH